MSTVHQAYFDAKAAIWDTLGDPASGERLWEIIGELAIQPGARVLDVGTGTGVLLPLLVPAVGPAGRVVALDLAGEMLKEAREKFPVRQVEFVQGDIIRPPFPAASFDEIICNACFPHLQDKPRAVRQMAALLKPGGRLVVCHASGREALNQMHRSLGGVVGNDLLPEAPVMHKLFTAAGLAEIKITDTPDRFVVTARKPAAGSTGPEDIAETAAVLAPFTPPVAAGPLAVVFRGFQEALLVYESLRLGIFTVLADQNRTPAEVAAGIGGEADRLAYVLDALTAIGLVEKEAVVYRNSVEARTYLWPGSKFYLGDLLELQLAPQRRCLWERLAPWVRGETVVPEYFDDPDGFFTGPFIRAMAQSALSQKGFAETVTIVARHPALATARRLLDLGGGHGLFAIALQQLRPQLAAAVFDLPHAGAVMQEYVTAYGTQTGFYPGNFHTDPLPWGQDIVLAFDMLYPTQPQNPALLAKIYGALRPGGYLFTRHWVLDETRTRPQRAALFALQSKVRRPKSHVYRQTELEDLLAGTGFVVEQSHFLGDSAATLIVAKKP